MKCTSYKVKGVKAFLKELSEVIRVAKQLRKLERNRKLGKIPEDIMDKATKSSVESLKFLARHHHIAYSEFRGRTREEIERKTNTEPDESLIKTIKDEMAKANPRQEPEVVPDAA